jgi:pentatricopeptide repeat protein
MGLRFFCFFTLLWVVSSDAFAMPPGIAKIEGLYAKKKYALCLSKIEDLKKQTRNYNQLDVYRIEMRCHHRLFETDADAAHLKKTLQIIQRLRKKYPEELPESIAEEADVTKSLILQALEDNKFNNSPRSNNLVVLASEAFQDAALYFACYEYFKEQDASLAETYLRQAVVKHYQDRKSGGSQELTIAFNTMIKNLCLKGKTERAREVYNKAMEVYANKQDISQHALDCIRQSLLLNSIGDETFAASTMDWLTAMGNSDLSAKEVQFLYWQEYFRYYHLIEPSVNKMVMAGNALRKLDLNSMSPQKLKTKYANTAGNTFNQRDSAFIQAYFLLNGFTTRPKQANALIAMGADLSDSGRAFMSFNLYQYAVRSLPEFKSSFLPWRKRIKTIVVEHALAGGSNDEFTKILQFYQLNKELEETKVATINRLVKLINDFAAAGNYSRCMRISKIGLSMFPEDPLLLKSKLTWMLADYQANMFNLDDRNGAALVNANAGSCTPGAITEDYQKQFMRFFNMVRRFAGIDDSCTLNAEYNAKCQKAAMIMTANSMLTHHPTSTQRCYTGDGYEAASHSNLSLGHNGMHALLGQLEDFGSNNTAVGHRRWILNPENTIFGHGSSENAMSLWTINDKYPDRKSRMPFDNNKDFVAWPTPDYFPREWLPNRWSFGMNADLSEVQITVVQAGQKIKMQKLPYVQGYGLNTIVWEMPDNLDIKKPVEVTITNVQCYEDSNNKKTTQTFRYRVTML